MNSLAVKSKANLTIFLFFIFFLPIFVFALYKGLELYLLGGFLLTVLVVLFFKYPKFWIYFSTLLFAVFLVYKGGEDEASLFEIGFAFLTIPGIFFYMFHKVFIKKEALVENYGDLFILLFVLFLPFNAIIAVLNGVELIRWVREVSIILFILYYFPIREYIKTEKDLIVLLSCALIANLSCVGFVVQNYRETTLAVANYAYELFGLAGKVKINHTVFAAGYFMSIILFVTRKNLMLRVLLFFTASASLIALIITVSRTFWIVTLLGTFILFVYYGWKERFRFIFFFTVISALTVGVIFWTFGSNYKVVTKLIEYRFLTATKGKQDRSVQSRLAEFPTVLNGIAEYPLGGNGFAKKIRFREPIMVRTSTSQSIHNGFTSLPFRAGIPLSLLYVAFFTFYFGRAFRLILLTKNHYLQPYVLSGFIFLVILFVSQFTFQQYLTRDFNFVGFIAIAMIEFVNRNYYRIEYKVEWN